MFGGGEGGGAVSIGVSVGDCMGPWRRRQVVRLQDPDHVYFLLLQTSHGP